MSKVNYKNKIIKYLQASDWVALNAEVAKFHVSFYPAGNINSN